MPHFFFYIADGTGIRDPNGIDLPDIEAARAHTLKFAGEMIQKLSEEVWKGHEWEVWVMDESGATVCSVVFLAKVGATPEEAAFARHRADTRGETLPERRP